jgi:hypothetical protein
MVTISLDVVQSHAAGVEATLRNEKSDAKKKMLAVSLHKDRPFAVSNVREKLSEQRLEFWIQMNLGLLGNHEGPSRSRQSLYNEREDLRNPEACVCQIDDRRSGPALDAERKRAVSLVPR